jgi:8-oxo-dGTP pyrophosphatase MutT (NUDIX family)
MFRTCPILEAWSDNWIADVDAFRDYKSVIPVRGAIILNKKMSKALMVRGWKGSTWGFPKGKINKGERDDLCAIREVYEEIGYDLSPFLNPDDYVEVTSRGKNIRLYIVRGVPGSTVFHPQTRKEISKIEWHDVTSLPTYSKKSNTTPGTSYHLVAPFMSGLKKYISKARGLVSDLSKQESKALMNLLGVGPTTTENGVQFANVEDDDEAAKQLLSMIKKSPAEDIKDRSDQKILLDLLNKADNTGESNQVESAKEILGLLRNQIDENRQVATAIPSNLGPLVPPPMWPAPGAVPGTEFLFQQPPFPMPGAPPIPVPPPSVTTTTSVKSNLQQEPVDYASLAPPAPPNPILQSLLTSRQGKKGASIGDSPNQRDPRFESSHTSNKSGIKLTDLLGEDKRGSGGLLSLLGGSSPRAESHIVQTNQGASGADLLGFLKGTHPAPDSQNSDRNIPELQAGKQISIGDLFGTNSAAKSNFSDPKEPTNVAQITPQAPSITPQVRSSGQALMDMLNPGKPGLKAPTTENLQTSSDNPGIIGQPSSDEVDRVPTLEHSSAARGKQLMDMLNPPSTNREHHRESSGAGKRLLGILNPPSDSAETSVFANDGDHSSSVRKPSGAGQQLLDMLGGDSAIASVNKVGKTAVTKQLPRVPTSDQSGQTLGAVSSASQGQSLLNMLNVSNREELRPTDSSPQLQEVSRRAPSASSRQLMSLLGDSTQSSPESVIGKPLEYSRDPIERHKSRSPIGTGQQLMGLVNSAATPSSHSTRTVPRATDSFLNRQSSPGDSLISMVSDCASIDSQPQPLAEPAIKAQPPLEPIGSPTTGHIDSPALSKGDRLLSILNNDFGSAISQKPAVSSIGFGRPDTENDTDTVLLKFLKDFVGSR